MQHPASSPPVVSILVPVYGVEAYVEQCVRSLMEQSYEACRYIFVDDCSTDRSVEIIRNTLRDYPHRQDQVRIIHHAQNRGVGSTRNTLLESAEGEYIIWVDSDDWADPLLVESMVTRAIISGADALRCGSVEFCGSKIVRVNHFSWLSGADETLRAILSQSHLVNNNIHGVLVRLDLIRQHNIRFAPDVDMGEDYTFLSQVLFHASQISTLYDPLYYYRVMREGSYMHSITPSGVESYVRANVWVTQLISSMSEEYNYPLSMGKVNIKKWISYRGLSPRHYDVAIFGESRGVWLRHQRVKIYNWVVDINNISLTKLFAGVLLLPLYLRVKWERWRAKSGKKRDNLWFS